MGVFYDDTMRSAWTESKDKGADSMNILEAQREMRSAFLGGFAGQLVSGQICLGGWLTGVILIVFAFVGRAVVLREEGDVSS